MWERKWGGSKGGVEVRGEGGGDELGVLKGGGLFYLL